ncbi:LuxR C-terminal-related transcriptional regulator [Myceligenerans indicum]|uniref:Helix-turn-helix transcriptional regulator n=1 Tax=Myceligenerans indicum TaxID=2593663 RepID=A0ABS1LQ03_9MICO|nr:helix-turn-helix transcriptional regulator [Myceligenerans indicum]MBL0888118.1 helix-turn-helix transcriptional regulator [Myceligenerans indicum]
MASATSARTEDSTTGTRCRNVAPHVSVALSDKVEGDREAQAELEKVLTAEQLTGAALLPDPLPAVPAARAAQPGLGGLDEDARRILLVAAVAVIDRAEVLLAAAGAGIDDLVSGPAGDHLHLVGGRFSFRDQRARQIVHDDADLAARTSAHLELARVLRASGRAEVALWHTALGTMEGDALLADGLVELAEWHLACGDTARAQEVAREAVSQGVGDTHRRAGAIASRAALLGGHVHDAVSFARQAGDAGPALTAALALRDGDPDPGLADVVESTHDRSALRAAVRALAVVHASAPKAAAILTEVLPDVAPAPRSGCWFEGPGCVTPLVEAHLRVVQALVAMRSGELDRAAAVLDDAARRLPVALAFGGLGVALARRLDLVRTGAVSPTTRALEESSAGMPAGVVRAAQLGDKAVEAAHAGRDVQAATFLGLAAERGGAELRAWWLPTPDPAELFVRAGQQRAARRHLAQLRGAVLGPAPRAAGLRMTLDLARAEVALAEPSTLQRAAERAVEVSQAVGSTFERGLTEVVISRALERHARDAEAAAHLLAARALFAESGALAFLPDSRVPAGAGAQGDGRVRSGPARQATGSGLPAEEVAENVTRLDVERQERGARVAEAVLDRFAHWGELLTERELDVARLVAQGRTNRQVAERLYVSVRTVEVHLGRVFRKLGVRSRTELAVLAHRTA